MASGGWLLRKLASLLLSVLSVVKSVYRRVVCRVRHSRRASGSLLPFTDQSGSSVAATATSDVQQSVPVNDVEFEQWDSWGAPSDAQSRNAPPGGAAAPQRQASQEGEVDVNFFDGMVPEIKRTAKILLKSREANTTTKDVLSSRLALKGDIPTPGCELQSWEATEGSWGAEESLDELAADAQLAVRETRRAERDQRHLVQQRRREERDAARDVREQMVAVRLTT